MMELTIGNIFDVVVIGETDSPSTIGALSYFSTLESAILIISNGNELLVIGETDYPSTKSGLRYFDILGN